MNKRLNNILAMSERDVERYNPARYRAQPLKYTFGLSDDEYNKLWHAQDGKCAICKGICITGRALCVDHCHDKGHVRGLLCTRCNTALGLLKDDISLLSRAITYLEG